MAVVVPVVVVHNCDDLSVDGAVEAIERGGVVDSFGVSGDVGEEVFVSVMSDTTKMG